MHYLSAQTEAAQTSPRSDEYKEDLKHGATRTAKYGERVLEVSDAVIAENVCGDTGFAGVQANVARGV